MKPVSRSATISSRMICQFRSSSAAKGNCVESSNMGGEPGWRRQLRVLFHASGSDALFLENAFGSFEVSPRHLVVVTHGKQVGFCIVQFDQGCGNIETCRRPGAVVRREVFVVLLDRGGFRFQCNNRSAEYLDVGVAAEHLRLNLLGECFVIE